MFDFFAMKFPNLLDKACIFFMNFKYCGGPGRSFQNFVIIAEFSDFFSWFFNNFKFSTFWFGLSQKELENVTF